MPDFIITTPKQFPLLTSIYIKQIMRVIQHETCQYAVIDEEAYVDSQEKRQRSGFEGGYQLKRQRTLSSSVASSSTQTLAQIPLRLKKLLEVNTSFQYRWEQVFDFLNLMRVFKHWFDNQQHIVAVRELSALIGHASRGDIEPICNLVYKGLLQNPKLSELVDNYSFAKSFNHPLVTLLRLNQLKHLSIRSQSSMEPLKLLPFNQTINSLSIDFEFIKNSSLPLLRESLKKSPGINQITFIHFLTDLGFTYYLLQGSFVRSLEITQSKMNNNQIAQLALSLAICPGVTKLRLINNQMDCNNVLTLLEDSQSLKNIRSLSFQLNYHIGSRGATGIAKLLSESTALAKLNLEQNKIDDIGGMELIAAIATNSILTKLNLNSNRLGATTMRAIGAILSMNSALQSLSLTSNNHLCHSIPPEEFLWSLTTNTTLKKLGLCATGVETNQAIQLAEHLYQNHSLSSLDLFANHIKDKAGERLAKALIVNTGIQKLNLGYNRLGLATQHAFSEMLKTNTTLLKLNLGFNKAFNEASSEALADALRENTTLKTLGLARMKLNVEAMSRFIEKLQFNTTLTRLVLAENEINNSCIDQLIALLSTRGLKSLRLNNNELNDESLARLTQLVCEGGLSLSKLNLMENSFISEAACNQLIDAVQQYNTSLTRLELEHGELRIEPITDRNQHNLQRKNQTLFDLLSPRLFKPVRQKVVPTADEICKPSSFLQS